MRDNFLHDLSVVERSHVRWGAKHRSKLHTEDRRSIFSSNMTVGLVTGQWRLSWTTTARTAGLYAMLKTATSRPRNRIPYCRSSNLRFGRFGGKSEKPRSARTAQLVCQSDKLSLLLYEILRLPPGYNLAASRKQGNPRNGRVQRDSQDWWHFWNHYICELANGKWFHAEPGCSPSRSTRISINILCRSPIDRSSTIGRRRSFGPTQAAAFEKEISSRKKDFTSMVHYCLRKKWFSHSVL